MVAVFLISSSSSEPAAAVSSPCGGLKGSGSGSPQDRVGPKGAIGPNVNKQRGCMRTGG